MAAAAVEQRADALGICWPVPIAPFEVVVSCLNVKKAHHLAAAEELYEQFKAAGIDVMFDDRKMSPGAKMKDLELMGFPFLVHVGRAWDKDEGAEVRDRPAGTKELLAKDVVVDEIVRRVLAARAGLLPQ